MPRIIKSAKLGDAAILKEIINVLKIFIYSLFFNRLFNLKSSMSSYSKVSDH